MEWLHRIRTLVLSVIIGLIACWRRSLVRTRPRIPCPAGFFEAVDDHRSMIRDDEMMECRGGLLSSIEGVISLDSHIHNPLAQLQFAYVPHLSCDCGWGEARVPI